MKQLHSFKNALLALLIFYSPLAISQVAVVDQTSFGAGITGGGGYGSQVAVTSTGKILIAGNYSAIDGTFQSNISSFNADGSYNSGFNTGGSGANTLVRAVRVQSDNKIWIGGGFWQYNGTTVPGGILLLNDDGTRDNTYNPATGTDNAVNAIGILPTSGDIVAGGKFVTFNGTSGIGRLARISATGVLNTTFNTNIGTGANGDIEVILVQPDEKIIVGGSFTSWNGSTVGGIVRLNTDGSLDGTFNVGTGANNVVRAIALQSTGQVLVSGDFTSWNGNSVARLVRVSSTGTFDAAFTAGAANSITCMQVLSNDKIIIGGNFTTAGTLSPLVLLPRNGLMAFNSDGTIDYNFLPNPGVNSGAYVNGLAVQSDGKLVMTGSFSQVNSSGRVGIARLCAGVGAVPAAETATITGVSATNVYAMSTQECAAVAKLVPNGATPITGNVTAQCFIDGTMQWVNGKPYLRRHYEIAVGSGTDARVTLYFTQADFDDFNSVPNGGNDLPYDAADVEGNKANIRFSKYPGASTGNTGKPADYVGTPILIDPDDNDIVWNATTGNWEVTFNVSGFSGFFMQTSLFVLPVSLKSFTAAAVMDGAKLSWTTASEQNTSHFMVERSVDGSYFHPTARVAAAGNSQTLRNYSLVDNLTKVPHGGTVYYRLHMVDKDGAAVYSNVQTVKLGKSNMGAALMSNPVQSEARIMYQAGATESVSFRLMDSRGRIVSQQQTQVVAGSNQIRIATANLSKGIYLLEINSKTGRNTLRLMKD